MLLNIPDTVKIGALPYKVKIVDEVCDGEDKYVGMIFFQSQEIRLRKKLPKEYMEKTLLHEILHGVLEFCSIEKLSEDQIDMMAGVLHQVLTENDL